MNTYGEVIKKKATKLQRMKIKAASAKCRWIFMSRCIKNDVLPKSFRTRPMLKTRRGYVLTLEYNKRMLKATCNNAKKQYLEYIKKIKEMNSDLREKITATDYEAIQCATDASRENKYKKESKRLKEKYENLLGKQRPQLENEQAKKLKCEVVDLTKDGIDDDVKEYLKLGPDFSETPKRLPYEKVIVETERMCQIIEKEKEKSPNQATELERETHKLREKVKLLLKKQMTRKIKSNLTHQEENGKKKAYKDVDRVYLPADKGKVMVAMDKSIAKGGENSYEYKMKKVLDDMKARPSIRAGRDWDLTEKVSREGREIVKEMVDKGEITPEYGRRLKPNDCRAPRITGYPKIHKDAVPLRGVVSFIKSPYEKIAKALVPVLRTLQGRSGHYIKNSRQLKEIVKDWSIQRDEILVSYDVEKLYPSIPVPKALELIECLLKCKRNLQEVTSFSVTSIMKMLKWIFSLTYCEYNGAHYVLDCGPIGLSVVGEVAIIYMEDFQMRAESPNFHELDNWPWYVDDSVLKCKQPRSEEILNHLNSIEPGIIIFTKEEEENGKLPSLDLELNVNRKEKKIEFNVHYKKTNTNITIKKKSNHRESTKRGVIKGYADRARSLCDAAYLEAELRNIQDVFVDNGYTKEETISAMAEKETEEERQEDEDKSRGNVVMPSIPGFTQQFNRIARSHDFKVARNAEC